MCKYIAYRWAKGELYCEFQNIFYIALREWKKDELESILKKLYFQERYKHKRIDINPFKTLFLFDGYDELSDTFLLHNTIKKYNLQNYIITSRPYQSRRSDFDVNEVFETIGFTDENVTAYIDNFFEEQSNKNNLQTFLKQNINIRHIAYIPLILEIICSIWRKKAKNNQLIISPMTMTELYHEVIKYSFSEYSETNHTTYLQEREDEIFDYLGKVAFDGLKNRDIVLGKSIIKEKKEFFVDYVLKTGFLKSDRKHRNPLMNNYEFPHLTFQEYFSALYVSKLSKKEISEVIREYKFYPYMEFFFMFLGGLIQDKEWLLEEIKSEPRDLGGFYEFLLILNLISNMQHKNLIEKRILAINHNLSCWLAFVLENEKNYIFLLKKLHTVEHLINNTTINFLISFIMNNTFKPLEKKEIMQLFFLKNNKKITNTLLSIINDKLSTNHAKLRGIGILVQINRDKNEIATLLIKLIQKKTMPISVRTVIFKVLKSINIDDDKFVEILVNLIQNKDYIIEERVHMAKILVSIKKYNSLYITFIKNLMEESSTDIQISRVLSPVYRIILKLDVRDLIKNQTIDTLAKIEIGKKIPKIKNNKEFINFLLSLMEKESIKILVRLRIVIDSSFIGKKHKKFIKILLIFLKDERLNFENKLEVAKLLVSIDKDNNDFLIIIINWLEVIQGAEEKKKNEYILELIKIICLININHDIVLTTLINLLQNTKVDYSNKVEVSEALYYVNSKKFTEIMIDIIKSDISNKNLKKDVIVILAHIIKNNNDESHKDKINIIKILDAFNEQVIENFKNIIYYKGKKKDTKILILLKYIKYQRKNKNNIKINTFNDVDIHIDALNVVLDSLKLKQINNNTSLFKKIFFRKNNEDEIENIIKNTFNNKSPLYIKNNKFYTIYKNKTKEIRLKRNAKLKDIKRIKEKLGLPLD
ncbi:MAG: Unknown protein [uncultured Sulfurovum sp.]|uniref:NACHT domain-containing protein n=1 Tax=uncultured Sulfurovum sp. TaxID=269237 RepID=A0A6S6TGS0_9BACT|nr:MAG: Unknown protein [uncultured Sulfurovum sp.]